jgi:hypothetical protein
VREPSICSIQGTGPNAGRVSRHVADSCAHVASCEIVRHPTRRWPCHWRRARARRQRVGFAGRFIDQGAGFRDEIVLQVAPVTSYRIATNSADVVVRAQHGAREGLQNDAESAGREVEVAGLDPDADGIRNPMTSILEIDVGNEVLAASLRRIEPVRWVGASTRPWIQAWSLALFVQATGPITGALAAMSRISARM